VSFHLVHASEINIIPEPANVSMHDGSFQLNVKTKIVNLNEAQPVAQYLLDRLNTPTGYDLEMKSVKKLNHSKLSNTIALSLVKSSEGLNWGNEDYCLKVHLDGIEITAIDNAGLFYGVQSLLQLLPPSIELQKPAKNTQWVIPCVNITDTPRFAWRGLMLDVSRHFFTKAQVKDFIDTMARYKFNVFHWHLTDDQGWRIEIKKYPKLTEVGAWRVPRQGVWWSFTPPKPGEKPTYGGYYTQEDIAEVVEYAKQRFITIVPEIDVPGHSLAAIASYPELSCGGGPFNVNPGSKFYRKIENTVCPSNENVYKFLDDVFGEIAELFPSKYIHMGGDEANKGFWKKCKKCQKFKTDKGLENEHQLQSYFVKQVEKILQSKGKKLLGWDEILEGGLAPNATVMSWRRGSKGAIAAAKAGHKVVMSPTPYCYLDLYQSDPIIEPDTYSMCRLKTSYMLENELAKVVPSMILGVQGNLWTESVCEPRHAQYMTWPRSLAIAETAWSPKEKKSWPNFTARVEKHFERMDNAQIKYSRSMFDAIFKTTRDKNGKLLITLETEIDNINIHYTFDNADPDNFYPKHKEPLTVPLDAKGINVVTYRNGIKVGKQINMPIAELEKRTMK
jgi:hexosaminidase